MTELPYSRSEASDYLRQRYGIRAKPATLAKYASLGGGPIFRHAGRNVVYLQEDLDTWALARMGPSLRSTSEITAAYPRRSDGNGG